MIAPGAVQKQVLAGVPLNQETEARQDGGTSLHTVGKPLDNTEPNTRRTSSPDQSSTPATPSALHHNTLKCPAPPGRGTHHTPQALAVHATACRSKARHTAEASTEQAMVPPSAQAGASGDKAVATLAASRGATLLADEFEKDKT